MSEVKQADTAAGMVLLAKMLREGLALDDLPSFERRLVEAVLESYLFEPQKELHNVGRAQKS